MTASDRRAAGHLRCVLCNGIAVVTRTTACSAFVARERQCTKCGGMLFTEERITGSRPYQGGALPKKFAQEETI
jgi:hypothetical protein